MLTHDFIFIGLLSVLFLFKRTRYASLVYLSAYVFYSCTFPHISSNYYHATSATINLFIFMLLFKDYKLTNLNDIFNLNNYTINQKVGLLSLLLILVNFLGCIKYQSGLSSTIYNSDYRFIVIVQISLLYIGNMIDAWVDRRDHQHFMVQLNSDDSFETFGKMYTEESE